MSKEYLWTELELPFEDEEKVRVWDELKVRKLKEIKCGECLFEFIKLGFSAIQIDTMLDLRPATIEKRCIEFLKQKEDNYDDFKFLFEKSAGLPRIMEVNRYLKSNHLNLTEFCKNEGINFEGFSIYLDNLSSIGYIKERLDEKNEQIQKQRAYPSTYKRGKWTTSMKCVIRLA